MAKCRILNIKTNCGYNLEGVDRIYLLDFADLSGFEFDGDDLYNNCLVVSILRSAPFIELDTPDSAKHDSSVQNGMYSHTLVTFIADISADILRNLHLATKRRYLPVFRTKMGRYFTYGYDAGATVTHTEQTTEATGCLVTVTAASIYPLFEVASAAMTGPDDDNFRVEYQPDYDHYTICMNG